jgi:hypothetical protein
MAVGRKKGSAKTGGRKKGVRNKTTALIKDAILTAGERAGGADGLAGYLERQANDNPGPFMALLGKVLPLQLAGDPDNPIQTTVTRIERKIVDPANTDA